MYIYTYIYIYIYTHTTFLPEQACTHGNLFNPPGDIPEQLAAYKSQVLSTALFILGTHLD